MLLPLTFIIISIIKIVHLIVIISFLHASVGRILKLLHETEVSAVLLNQAYFWSTREKNHSIVATIYSRSHSASWA